jgi:hypothetical protein
MRHQEHRNIATCRSMDRRLERNPRTDGGGNSACQFVLRFVLSLHALTKLKS